MQACVEGGSDPERATGEGESCAPRSGPDPVLQPGREAGGRFTTGADSGRTRILAEPVPALLRTCLSQVCAAARRRLGVRCGAGAPGPSAAWMPQRSLQGRIHGVSRGLPTRTAPGRARSARARSRRDGRRRPAQEGSSGVAGTRERSCSTPSAPSRRSMVSIRTSVSCDSCRPRAQTSRAASRSPRTQSASPRWAATS